jgi:formamidopyrimidine-DNA glycosylase
MQSYKTQINTVTKNRNFIIRNTKLANTFFEKVGNSYVSERYWQIDIEPTK